LNYYKNFNINSKSKKGHNSVKMLDRVTSSCLQVGVMMVNKRAKFQSHMSMDFENFNISGYADADADADADARVTAIALLILIEWSS
jgi:hypothetical protein